MLVVLGRDGVLDKVGMVLVFGVVRGVLMKDEIGWLEGLNEFFGIFVWLNLFKSGIEVFFRVDWKVLWWMGCWVCLNIW